MKQLGGRPGASGGIGDKRREIKKVPHGRLILLPITDATRGQGTRSLPAIWGKYLADLLEEMESTEVFSVSAGGRT